MKKIQCVPPAPDVMSTLYLEYLRVAKGQDLTFRQYLEVIGYSNPAHDLTGMDDGTHFRAGDAGPELIDIPTQPITGPLQVKVLLIDFPDRPGMLPRQHYEDLLFSQNIHPTGSMRDYFSEVSLGQVEIAGSVHGWLRMPEPYSFYTNGESGTTWNSYPRNAPRMAEDAVRKALEYGVRFEPELDNLNQGIITALFIVHAGRGAETLHPSIRGNEIWSHKWQLRNPVTVRPQMAATIYLTVPHDCKVGVCAHELGHLAFQWQDFYDPNYDSDGVEWSGSGRWDLMAGGSYNGNSATPAHPAGLHKTQHGWIEVETINLAQTPYSEVTLKPYTKASGKVVKIISPKYKNGQYLVLENRARTGFDFHLPGEGLLVWRVDETGEMEAPDKPGLLLIQADGLHGLENDWDQGDAGDPFPGLANRTELGDTGNISTSFPGQDKSGVFLSNIHRVPESGAMKLEIKFSDG